MPAELTFGKWLQRRRLSLGLTQAELARRSGYSEHTLRAVEADKRRPGQEMAQRLAVALNVPTEDRAAFVRFARDEGDEVAFPLPALPVEPTPLPSPHGRPHDLPTPLTSIIGREKEMGALQQLLQRPDIRLVTLTGVGGSGKTRLALAVAADLRDQFSDGVYFVNLAPIVDPDLVISTIAHSLDVREQGGKPLLESLKDALREKHLLLLLDNFEQVIAAATVVSELLAAAPNVKALVTSREVLHLRGEQDYPLSPLALPDLRHLPQSEQLSQYAAVALFIQRAVSARPDFQVTNANAPAVAEICWRLDGLPLAIELAAARIRVLTPDAMLKRLDSRLKLLTGGARDVHDRQRTLRGTIEWSYDLLNAEEQRLFRRLGVFVGGWTLEAAEAVAQDRLYVEGWTVDESTLNRGGRPESFAVAQGGLDVLEGLGSLLDKSLVHQREDSVGEMRFSMLETIREYAGEQLVASGEAEELRYQHAAYFLPLAQQAVSQLRGPNQMIWLKRLEREHDNMRAAMAWAQHRHEVELGLRLSGALASFWYRHSHIREGSTWLQTFLRQDDEEGQPMTPASLVLARACAVSGAGELAYRCGRFREAAYLNGRAVELYRAAGDRWGEAWALNNLGITSAFFSDRGTAKVTLETSGGLFEEIGDRWGRGVSLANQCLLALNNGDFDQALTLGEASQALLRRTGDESFLASTINILGDAYRSYGNCGRAKAYYEESLSLGERVGDKVHVVEVFYNLGQVALVLGEAVEAAAYFDRCLRLGYETGSTFLMAADLAGIACVAELVAQPATAARLLGAAHSLFDASEGSLQPVDRVPVDKAERAARAALGDAAFAAEVVTGHTLTLDEAIALALQVTSIVVTGAPKDDSPSSIV